MDQITTRFAPSPTGYLHIGGLRTAAYAYAYARHNKGKFILRIEDTDQKREVQGSREKIYEILKIFGIEWDELFVQSERVNSGIYENAGKKLVDEGHAFYCQCDSKNAKKDGYSQILRDPCRDKELTSGAIKLKTPDNEKVSYTDFVSKKQITWDTKTVTDATLLKSDGFPTYHLAVVVDDHDMNISHVFRGHDWLPSTPIHLLVYKYLNYDLPEIGHLTDILDPEGGKLSKRKGNVSCEQLMAEGFLPEALFNFVILLGWAPKDNRELFTLKDFVEAFNENGFQKSNPVFNRDKLDWFNGQYIQKKTDAELADLLLPYLNVPRETMLELTPLVKERIKKLSDIKDLAGFFLEEPREFDRASLPENYKDHLKVAAECIEKSDWNSESLTGAFMDAIKNKGFKVGDFFMTLRIAMSGKRFTPPITECIVLLGKDESLLRIKSLE